MTRPLGDPPGLTDLFEAAPCGYIVLDDQGVVRRANAEFLRILGTIPRDVVDVRTLGSLLSAGGRIMLETHLMPLLEHGDRVREIALELVRPDGVHVPIILNAAFLDPATRTVLVVLIEARDRHRYENDLLAAKRAAEDAHDHAAALAMTLQQTLIPPAPPVIPHLGISAAYRPAGRGREVGGDFYDVFQVGLDSWLVVVGDVSGKGIPAAVVTSFVRYQVRSLAMAHQDPADLLRALDESMLARETERYCTLAVVRLDRIDGHWDMMLALAGHPPALLRTAAGATTELGFPGTPVGLVSEPQFHTVHHRLGGETVVIYTDGVTEARSKNGMYGEERLAALVESVSQEPAVMTESIAREALAWQLDDASDDIAIVAFAAT